ncbi:MAG: NnrS family protein [Alphaproteobacteria bacterium]|nr:NnrS family protein [Alphaproteobacteria bacterium]MCB9686067.1 NnrS family protein [Alphaproteobacteria bacterium]
MSALEQLGAKGFRPFFLLAGIFAVVVVPAWVWSLTGGPAPRGVLGGMSWHAHEMIFGFTVAVISGFLLTAVENWTGQPTLRGSALLGVAGVWAAARIALWWPGWVGPALDLMGLPLVALGIGRPLWQTRNLRNLPFVALLGGLWLTNLTVYLEAAGVVPGSTAVAHRVAVHLIAVIILVVAGRVVPMFTRNATGDERVHRLATVDRVAIGATVVLAALQPWPTASVTGVVAGVAGAATLARMWGWWSPGVWSRPLLWVLHLGHASVGVGLSMSALVAIGVPVGSSALHLITVGGIGLLTIGMMARVSLGHTGRPIFVGTRVAVAFSAVALAAVVRAFGPLLEPSRTSTWWWGAAALWAFGFALFVWMYARILITPRADGRPG